MRARPTKEEQGKSEGVLLESLGYIMSELGTQLAEGLEEFTQLQRAGPSPEGECSASGQLLTGGDLWQCRDCGMHLHRVCFESLGGCVDPDCEGCADGVPAALTRRGEAERYQQLLDSLPDEPDEPIDWPTSGQSGERDDSGETLPQVSPVAEVNAEDEGSPAPLAVGL